MVEWVFFWNWAGDRYLIDTDVIRFAPKKQKPSLGVEWVSTDQCQGDGWQTSRSTGWLPKLEKTAAGTGARTCHFPGRIGLALWVTQLFQCQSRPRQQ